VHLFLSRGVYRFVLAPVSLDVKFRGGNDVVVDLRGRKISK